MSSNTATTVTNETPKSLMETNENTKSDIYTGQSNQNNSDTTTTFFARLRAQIEFYFSPQNLSRDTYLRTLLSQYGGGAVPLSVITSFPKVRELFAANASVFKRTMMSEPLMVMKAVEGSYVVAVSSDGIWISPRLPLPPIDPTIQQRQMGIANHFLQQNNTRLMNMNLNDKMGTQTLRSYEQTQGISNNTNTTNPSTHSKDTQTSVTSSSTGNSVSSVNTSTSNTPENGSSLGKPVVPRNTVILRDIPSDWPKDKIANVFTFDSVTPKTVRPDVGNTWYITFLSESDALDAVARTRNQSIDGLPVKARIKSEAVPSMQNQVGAPPSILVSGSGRALSNPSHPLPKSTPQPTGKKQLGVPDSPISASAMRQTTQPQMLPQVISNNASGNVVHVHPGSRFHPLPTHIIAAPPGTSPAYSYTHTYQQRSPINGNPQQVNNAPGQPFPTSYIYAAQPHHIQPQQAVANATIHPQYAHPAVYGAYIAPYGQVGYYSAPHVARTAGYPHPTMPENGLPRNYNRNSLTKNNFDNKKGGKKSKGKGGSYTQTSQENSIQQQNRDDKHNSQHYNGELDGEALSRQNISAENGLPSELSQISYTQPKKSDGRYQSTDRDQMQRQGSFPKSKSQNEIYGSGDGHARGSLNKKQKKKLKKGRATSINSEPGYGNTEKRKSKGLNGDARHSEEKDQIFNDESFPALSIGKGKSESAVSTVATTASSLGAGFSGYADALRQKQKLKISSMLATNKVTTNTVLEDADPNQSKMPSAENESDYATRLSAISVSEEPSHSDGDDQQHSETVTIAVGALTGTTSTASAVDIIQSDDFNTENTKNNESQIKLIKSTQILKDDNKMGFTETAKEGLDISSNFSKDINALAPPNPVQNSKELSSDGGNNKPEAWNKEKSANKAVKGERGETKSKTLIEQKMSTSPKRWGDKPTFIDIVRNQS
eukprot:CAMPEP_0184860980 /NCGR_PEP_ID=MMETSP0580-20130426/5761_1 /TAXON_ID=1118495 /ORGANISM="Dactyliosolen fragilissimus" /LENGTH=941 /DNA_ID=CAMNT_0027358283 /DNA_START=165 /DNA_END=2990 /DNA_ORIENTATION=-